MPRLNRWREMARSHWQKYRPKMYNDLKQSGKLESSLDRAAERTQNEYISGAQSGMNPWEAQSEAEKNNLLLPSEEDMPHLGERNPASPDPASFITTPGNEPSKPPKRSRKHNSRRPN